MFYFILFTISVFIYILFDNKGNNIKARGWGGLGLIIALLCIIAGCRDLGIGTDTLIYSADYYYCASLYDLKDVLLDKIPMANISIGFFVLNKLAIWVCDSIYGCFFATELCILGVLIVYKKFQRIYKFSFILLLILYLFLYYNQTFNYMRQLCAVTFTFAAYYLFINKKYILCIGSLIIGYLFHTSAIVGIIPLVIHVISNIDSPKRRKVISVIYIFAMGVGFLAFNAILTYLAGAGILLSAYAERYGVGTEYTSGVSTAQLLFLLMGYILIYISHRKRILPARQNLRVLLLHTTNFALMLFGLYSVFLFRISFYVAIPDMLYLVMILSSNKAHRLARIGYTVFAMLVWLYLYIIVTDCATYPYTSKLLGIS